MKKKKPPLANELVLNDISAGRLLDVCPATLWRWRRKGVGPDYILTPSRSVFYTRASIGQWLKRRMVRASTRKPIRAKTNNPESRV